MQTGWVQASCPLLSQAVPANRTVLLGSGVENRVGFFFHPLRNCWALLVEEKSCFFLSFTTICLLRQEKAEPGSCGPGQLLGIVAGS